MVPAPRRHLDVAADLVVTHEQGDMHVTGRGDRIVIDLPGPSFGRALARMGFGQVGSPALAGLDRALKGSGLGCEVTIKNRRVAQLGSGAQPRFMDRVCKLRPLQVSYGALVRSLLPG